MMAIDRVRRIRIPAQGRHLVSEPVSPPPTVDQLPSDVDEAAVAADDQEFVVEELLVEEISIDGMCGVY